MAAPNKPEDKNKANDAGASNKEEQVAGHSTTAKETDNPNTQDPEKAPAAASPQLQSAADQGLEDTRGRTFGDTTSSMGGKNNPGQHGRDGGSSIPTDHPLGFDHNPPPSEAAVDPNVEEEQREEQREDAEKNAGGTAAPRTL
jgi:hypothetical protein